MLVALADEHGALATNWFSPPGKEGELAFVAEVLARRSGLASGTVQDQLLSGDTQRVIPCC